MKTHRAPAKQKLEHKDFPDVYKQERQSFFQVFQFNDMFKRQSIIMFCLIILFLTEDGAHTSVFSSNP